MGELQELEESFTPVGDSRSALPLTRRNFIGAGVASPALPLLLGSTSTSAALLSSRKCESTMRFEEDANGLTITWYPELEIGEQPPELGNKACAQPPKPSKTTSELAEKARSWRLIRKAFGPDAKFRLRLDRANDKEPDVVYSLEVTGVRFGKLAGRTLLFKFAHQNSHPKKWTVELSTDMWGLGKASLPIAFSDLCDGADAIANSPARKVFEVEPDLPEGSVLELESVNAKTALQRIFGDDLQVKEPVRLQLATNGVWSILPPKRNSQQPSPFRLADGALSLPKGLRMAWCDPDPASLEGDAASRPSSRDADEQKKDKAQQSAKPTPTGRPEKDPVFLAWGEVDRGELLLGTTRPTPRAVLTAMPTKLRKNDEDKPADAQQKEGRKPASATPHAGTTSASEPARIPPARTWPDCVAPTPKADWTAVAGDPADSEAFQRPPQWRFLRRDWLLKPPLVAHPTGVASIRASWYVTVSTDAGKFGPILVTDGVFQRGFTSEGAKTPTLRFAGQLSTTNWEIDTRIGKLWVKGAHSDSSIINPQTASARTHRPLMTLSSSGYADALSSLDVPLLLLRSDLALEGCEFSEFNFAPTGLRAVYDRDAAKARDDLRVSDSYLWLGDPAALRELPLAHIDLTRARIDVARPQSLARLGFMFAGLNLDVADGKAWITDRRASCRVRQRIEPSGNGEPIVVDTRPVLVAEFPPQHVFEEAVFRPSEAPLPDVVVKKERPTFTVLLNSGAREFSIHLPELLRQLEVLELAVDHKVVRSAYARLKRDQDKAFGDFADEFKTLCDTAIDSGSLPPLPDRGDPNGHSDSFSPAYNIYIGPDELPPALMAKGREANKKIRHRLVEDLLDASLKRAERFIDLLNGKPPTTEEIGSKFFDFVTTVLAKINPFKSKPEWPISPRDHARMVEQATGGALQDYASFRDFYAGWILEQFGAESLLPDDMEFFSPTNRAGLNFKSTPSVDDRADAAKADYVSLLQNMNAPKAVMRARLSGASRLAFHVDCGSRPHMDVEDGDAHFLAQGDAPGTRLPFSFDALTDWAHYDLAVTPRAREAAAFDEGGVLIRREVNEEGRSEDDSASADVAMLKSLGLRSGQEPKRPQRPGSPRDWGKKLRTLQERLTDVEASLSVIPDALQTAIEIPARLILSPSQKGQWRTRRNELKWAPSSPGRPVPLWTANLNVDGVNPLVRAVASPDMRPEFVRFALERRLFGYQRTVPNAVALHAPAGAAPPRGPRAPWTLGFEESDPNTSKIEDLYKATTSLSEGENKSEENICAASSAAVATSAAAAASAASAIVSTTSAVSAPESAASAPSETLTILHPLVDYLCSRQIERKGYADHAVFRSTLDAYDRHEIVLLSSAWGLPVRGRREKTGQLQALRFSSQVELPEEWHLLDAEAGTAIYRPRALKVQELALTALGGTLRHDSDFVPPAAARHIVHGPLFDSMSVERWQHWTVLGRDVFAEVVYKGYLFPIGHRASLVKQTERIFLAPAKTGSKDLDLRAPLRCYLRQRMFIRVARPEKVFPAYGQPNGGRMFPADVARMLTLTTPDIVDPTEDNTLPQASKGEMAISPGGRLYANEAGLVFWPRTARIAGAEVVFDVQIQGAATKSKLIFVDNVAVNRPDLMDRLVQDYNALPSPDLTSNNQVDLQSPDLQKHLRTLDLHGQSLRYCDEIKPGSASHKTLSWTLKATGGVGVTNTPRPSDKDLVINKYEGPVFQFDDPLLEGADQPPFYPAIHTARIRIDQVERLTGGSPQAAVAQFEGWYVRNGFERDKRTQEIDRLGIYMDIVNKVTMDMGSNGSRSGGVMRPAGEVIALSRERGPLTGTGRLEQAGAIDTVVDRVSGFPLTPAPAPAPQRASGSNDETLDEKNAKRAFDKFFGGNDVLKTKILGLVSVSDLVEFLDVKNAAAELPLLREVVEYGMSGAEGAADSLRTNVIAPLHQLILELGRQWDKAGKSVNERSGGLFNGMADVFPDVNSALQDLKSVLSATSADTDNAAVLTALSGIYECGRRLMDACGRVATNPLDQLQVAVKQKLEGFNKQIEGFNFRPDQLSPKTLLLAVYGHLPEFEKRLMEGAFARLQNLQGRLKTLRGELEKAGENATYALARVEELEKVLKDAETGITAALENAIDSAPGPGTFKTPLLQAEDLLLSMMKEFDGAVNKVRPRLAAVEAEPGSAADKALKDFTTSLIAAQAHTAATLAEWSSPDLIARSEYRRAVANLATLLRLYTTVRTLDGNRESLLAQVSQVLLDYLTAQIGPRRPDFPQLEVEAENLRIGVLEPISGGAKKVLAGIVDTELVFPLTPLPDLSKKNALDKWPVSAGGKSVVQLLQAVAKKAHDEIQSSKLKDPQFKPLREQLAQLGTSALAAQVILHRAAIGVRLLGQQNDPFDKKNLQTSMQRIDSTLRELERLGESAVLALKKLRDDLIAISQEEARDALTEPVRAAVGSIIQWFLDLNGTLRAKISDSAEKVEPKSFLQPWLALLDEYDVRISSTRTLVANTTEWIDDPSKLLPALRDPTDAAQQTGIQAVLLLQRVLVDKAMDWAASFVAPVEAAADELKIVFTPLLELLKKSYAELEVQRKNVLEAAGATAGQLLVGAMLVGVDKNVVFVTGKQPDDSQTDASAPDKDQLHWDTQSLEHLLKAKLSTLRHSEQLRAFNFMNYLVTGWRNRQATPLRIVEQLKRLSLEEIRARLVALINFGAIREEIEERIKLLIPSAVTMSYDFSTTMSDQARAATAGVFCPKHGCALTVRTRARVDLLQANAPTFLSIGELGAFDIKLLGSFDAVTLHFKGVRFTSRGGPPECDLQYEGFTIGKQLEYLSQLTPFFGSKAGSGFYLQPLDSGIGVEAGYRLDLGAFTVGNLAIFNVSLNAAARLPFDNRGATFVASLSRRDSPFTIAIAPYGGSGFFALEADTKGIVGFEASFEYGGAGAFAYGPLSGQGRLMVGAYIRSRYDHTEIFATFYVGGSASIWIFNFGASLYVNAKQEGSQMKGTATYTFSFSMGIVDYDYKVAVNVALSLDGSSDDKAQKKQADKTVGGDAGRWLDEGRPVRLASLDSKWGPGDAITDVAAHPLAMMVAAGAEADVRKPATRGTGLPPASAKRRVATKCQTESWSTFSNYFDRDLAKKVQKLKAVY